MASLLVRGAGGAAPVLFLTARDAVADRATAPGWSRTVTVAEAAAFHAYQRGARDYEP